MAPRKKKESVVTNQLNGEPLRFTAEGEPINYLSSEKDAGTLPFNKREPLRVKFTLFGKEREEFDCGGMISACIKPDENGKVSVMTAIMGVADAEVLLMMMKGMVEHISEILSKIEEKEGVPGPKIMQLDLPNLEDDKELLARMALSRMSSSKTHH
jgi:hypothetical protein